MAMGRELILQTNAQQKHLVDPLLQMRRRALKRADAFKQAQAREDGDEDGEAGGANEAYAFLPQVPSLGTPLSFSPCRTRLNLWQILEACECSYSEASRGAGSPPAGGTSQGICSSLLLVNNAADGMRRQCWRAVAAEFTSSSDGCLGPKPVPDSFPPT